ncbi:MAG: Xaa-Pro peptidase family protein [Pirellulaceae bacterium]|nr:Xaa-Pro peptidase family protein [Pirellulaceae bacterium]
MSAEKRLAKLKRAIRSTGADAMLVTNFVNVSYLTGFTGDDSFLFVGADQELLITDERYTIQLGEECPDLKLVVRAPGQSIHEALAKVLKSARVRLLAVEAESVTIGLLTRLEQASPQIDIVSTSGAVEQLRMIKDRSEIAATRHAVEIAEKAFAVVRAGLRPEQTELDVANQIDQLIRLFGGSGCSFPPIVAVGERSALPHATPGNRLIGDANLVLIDWGAIGSRYMSDLTRVLVTGKISPKLEKVYEVVLKAQRRAIQAIRPGRTLHEVDAVARKIIADAGYGKYFGHGLGHGIGLEIHEAPRLAPGQKLPLAPGMIVTVEPGIYLPRWGGIRIEDDILVTKQGHEVLTNVEKELSASVVS